MAERPAFFNYQNAVISRVYSFEWFPGFAAVQKQRSIESLHSAIQKADPDARALEVSTKSRTPIGVKLSAFNLRLKNNALENIFQSAKVFEDGGPYLDLLQVPPREAKRDIRLHNSGALKAFCYQGVNFPLFPQTVFYDYIYIAAVKESLAPDDIREITAFNYFTDIEFNPARSLNTQARSVSLIKLLLDEYGDLPDLSKEDFIQYHREHVKY